MKRFDEPTLFMTVRDVPPVVSEEQRVPEDAKRDGQAKLGD
ncbi:MAG: hypothetical protein P0119_06965 [Nitrospira sp.]|nr:hypothetical protein [Nitrospira sp.]